MRRGTRRRMAARRISSDQQGGDARQQPLQALLVQDETDGVTEWRIDPHVRPVELIEAISRDGIDVRLDGELIVSRYC